jgi:hypothetical protein
MPTGLHSGELHNLCSSPDIIRQIKSRRMRWAGHVARMGEGRNANDFGWKALRKRPVGRSLSIYGRLILKSILQTR